jgi:hypothetical protein
LGRKAAPDGATIEVSRVADSVVVVVRCTVRGPGGLFDKLPGVDVHARAVAVEEDP